jgi:hypothetical protein
MNPAIEYYDEMEKISAGYASIIWEEGSGLCRLISTPPVFHCH